MIIPNKTESQELLNKYVKNKYQILHANMVANVMEKYAEIFNKNKDLWYTTGLLHDIDYELYPNIHPKESLIWFKELNFSNEITHAIEAHAYSYNGFTTMPNSKLAGALLACDEMCGLFYAYKSLNPIEYSNMKFSSILKRFNDKSFAIKIDRNLIKMGCDFIGISIEEHINNLIKFLD